MAKSGTKRVHGKLVPAKGCRFVKNGHGRTTCKKSK